MARFYLEETQPLVKRNIYSLMVYAHEHNVSHTLAEVIVERLSGAWRNSQFIQNLSRVKGMVVIPPDHHKAWKSPCLFR